MQAVDAHAEFHHQIAEIAATFNDQEWHAPSACAGWRVQDVIAHMAVGARGMFDPLELPATDLVAPDNRERQHDMHVELRHDWSSAQVLDEFITFGEQRIERLRSMQDEPEASEEIALGGLGTYPKHTLANAYAFDYFCHLHHDLGGPHGSIRRNLSEVSHDQIYPGVQWMMWGLPQMQGSELDNALFAPITIELTGPGASTWTVRRPDPAGGLVVEEAGGAEITVTSTATDFFSWGTARTPWQASCSIDGDPTVATAFLSTLNIV